MPDSSMPNPVCMVNMMKLAAKIQVASSQYHTVLGTTWIVRCIHPQFNFENWE